MNTNGNLYTIIYTSVIVVLVAALLAFVSQSLKAKQEANEKADIMSQMMTADGIGSKASFQEIGNAAVLEKYAGEISEAFLVNAKGEKTADIDLSDVWSPSLLKAQNNQIKKGELDAVEVPVFKFKNGTTVVPIYGAGLWGPVWGYIAFEADGKTMIGSYFDHESETAGLGARIKDDTAFQDEFTGEMADFTQGRIFEIVKGGAPKEGGKSVLDNKIDAITGATMTSQGLNEAINNWLAVYKAYLTNVKTEEE
ncbi:MAG: NADH:ubiquinone reductase (Na(+)-transporting) subunit C [Bacteroidales bacterium]|nr:NADH:ubiquinone reductase (Na(+)-transporting) subunit C [Bacteroidales bacterium]